MILIECENWKRRPDPNETIKSTKWPDLSTRTSLPPPALPLPVNWKYKLQIRDRRGSVEGITEWGSTGSQSVMLGAWCSYQINQVWIRIGLVVHPRYPCGTASSSGMPIQPTCTWVVEMSREFNGTMLCSDHDAFNVSGNVLVTRSDLLA